MTTMRVLNRIVEWTDNGTEYAADQRHADIICQELGLAAARKGVATPADWQVGQDVLGMSEWPEGKRIDVHSMVHLGDFDYKDRDDGNFLGEGFSNAHSAAHEQNEGGKKEMMFCLFFWS